MLSAAHAEHGEACRLRDPGQAGPVRVLAVHHEHVPRRGYASRVFMTCCLCHVGCVCLVLPLEQHLFIVLFNQYLHNTNTTLL